MPRKSRARVRAKRAINMWPDMLDDTYHTVIGNTAEPGVVGVGNLGQARRKEQCYFERSPSPFFQNVFESRVLLSIWRGLESWGLETWILRPFSQVFPMCNSNYDSQIYSSGSDASNLDCDYRYHTFALYNFIILHLYCGYRSPLLRDLSYQQRNKHPEMIPR